MVQPFYFDVSRLLWRAWKGRLPTGIDRTCLAYLEHYRNRIRAVVQIRGATRVLRETASQALFDILLSQDEGTRARLLRLIPACIRDTSDDIAGRIYLNVGHTGLDKPGHAAWLSRSRVRPIYFVHDLIPLSHPQYCREGEPEKHMRRMMALLKHGAGVIGNSHDTFHELTRFASRESLLVPPMLVASLGGDVPHGHAAPSQSDRISPDRPFFVILGTIEGRKNHLLILNVWAELIRKLGSRCPQLVVIGQRGWECEQVVDMLERCEALRGHVIELPRCDDGHLSAYLTNATALLFPSFVEGFGLPLVEALGHGTPVIASDLAVFRELAASVPEYLSPIDGLGWMGAIESYAADDSPERAAQLQRLAGWTPPTWKAHFAKVDEWLDQLN